MELQKSNFLFEKVQYIYIFFEKDQKYKIIKNLKLK